MQTVGVFQCYGILSYFVDCCIFVIQSDIVVAGENISRVPNSSISSETLKLAGQLSNRIGHLTLCANPGC